MPHDDDGDTRAIVAQLKTSTQALLARLPEIGESMLLLCPGVVVTNETYEYFQRALSFRDDVDDRFVRCVYGIAHESVHMTQLVSAHFVLETTIEFANLCALANRGRKAGAPLEEWLPNLLRDYRKTQHRLKASDGGFSTLQVIEAHAVIEGFRGAFSKHTQEGLVQLVRIAHGLQSDYAEMIGRLLGAFGFAFTLNVAPKLCWLALQTSAPGAAFTNALLSLETTDVGLLNGLSACELCAAFGIDPNSTARSLRMKVPALRNHHIHELFGGYFDAIERETDPEAFLQLVMHPGHAHEAHAKVRMTDLMPPLTVFSDDRYQMHGPYRDKGWSAAKALIELAMVTTQTLDWLDEQADRFPS
jgi:hypothetical protein